MYFLHLGLTGKAGSTDPHKTDHVEWVKRYIDQGVFLLASAKVNGGPFQIKDLVAHANPFQKDLSQSANSNASYALNLITGWRRGASNLLAAFPKVAPLGLTLSLESVADPRVERVQ